MRCCLPLRKRRRLRDQFPFEAQSRGLYAPCVRFAAGVTPAPRNTRLRLVPTLCRDRTFTCRVPLERFRHVVRATWFPLSPSFAWRNSRGNVRAHRVKNPDGPVQVERLTVPIGGCGVGADPDVGRLQMRVGRRECMTCPNWSFRRDGYRPAVGPEEADVAALLHLHGHPSLVDGPMMTPADQHEVVEARRAAVAHRAKSSSLSSVSRVATRVMARTFE